MCTSQSFISWTFSYPFFLLHLRAVIIFGLNTLYGRVPLSDGSLGGPWNSTNAAALIRYTVSKGYTINGWELGKTSSHLHTHLRSCLLTPVEEQ